MRVTITGERGTVVLSGTVHLHGQKLRHEQIAWRTRVPARSRNEIRVEPLIPQYAVGAGPEDVVQALQELGYDPETVPPVYLTPLVQVAWADDRLTAREREYIEAAARARGIEVGSTADQQRCSRRVVPCRFP